MWGVGVGAGVGVRSRGSTRMASRERGIGAAFWRWFEARVGTEARKGRRNMGMRLARILKRGCVVDMCWPKGGSFDRL